MTCVDHVDLGGERVVDDTGFAEERRRVKRIPQLTSALDD